MNKEKQTILILCVIIILLLGVSMAAIVLSKLNTAESKYANVYQNGNLIRRIDLNSVDKTYTFTVDGKDGEKNTIEVRHGEIGIVSASCPDHLCVNMGFISTGIIPVTCLPNHVVIEITGAERNGEEQEPDGVVY